MTVSGDKRGGARRARIEGGSVAVRDTPAPSGGKIEKAVEYVDRYGASALINEDDWANAV